MSKPKARVRLWSEQSPEPVPSHGGPAVGTYWKLSIDDVVLGSEYDRRHWCADRQKYTKIEYAPRNLVDLFNKLCEVFDAPGEAPAVENGPEPTERKFALGDMVRKKSGSWWEGRIVGFYSTEQTPDGVCVQLDKPMGPVQIYPTSALEKINDL